MYITINDVIDEKRIDLSYPIKGKDTAAVSMLSDNVLYWLLVTSVTQNGQENCAE